jgi:hypothetical protein
MSDKAFTSPQAAEPPRFSWPRFQRLARAQWAEQRSQYLGHMLVVGMLYVVLLLFLMVVSGFSVFRTGAQSVFYFAGLYLTGFVFAGRYFVAMAQRESALLALMRPASVLEKWLLCVLVVAVGYPVAYTLLYLAVSWPVQQLAVAGQAAMAATSFAPADYALFVPFWPAAYRQAPAAAPQMGLLVGIWALQAFAVAGSLYYQRATMLKTLALGFGLFVLTGLVCSIAGVRLEVVFAWWSERRAVRLDAGVHAINAVLWIGLPTLLWVQAYLHLKEKELL